MKQIQSTSFEDVKSFLSDKSNYNFLREMSFSRRFNHLYSLLCNWNFPQDFKFTQKLYHFFNNDMNFELGICPMCKSRCKFLSFYEGYTKFCSKKCAYVSPDRMESIFKTNLERYGVKMSSMLPEYVEKQKQTYKQKTGYDFPMQNPDIQIKSIETNIKKRGVKYILQDDNSKEKAKLCKKEKYGYEFYNNHSKSLITKEERYGDKNYNNVEKAKQTCLEKYGVSSYSKTYKFKEQLNEQNKERVNKIFSTKKKNNTSNSSKIEEQFSQYLSEQTYKFIRNYYSEQYPYHCDFYLPDYDLYIEIQGNWTHGKHPFNKNDKDDLNIVEKWKSKKSKYYNKAINDWTVRDVIKRQIAKENGLNYLEIFSDDIEIVIKTFEDYLLKIKG